GSAVAVILRVDAEVLAQQIRKRQIGRCLAVGDRRTCKDERTAGAVRVRELPEEPRFANPRFADHRDDLAMASMHELDGVLEAIHLPVTADEARKPPRSHNLHAGAGGAGPRELIGLDRFAKPLDGEAPEGADLDIALS